MKKKKEEEEDLRGRSGCGVGAVTSVVSQLPICGQFEMLTSAFFHVQCNGGPALDCFIYLDASAVERMNHPRHRDSVCVRRENGKRDPAVSQNKITGYKFFYSF